MRKKTVIITFSILLLLAISPVFATAAVDLGLNSAAGIGLSQADLKTTIVNIIRILLGFLGLVAVIFILYGGYVYLTAGGNEEKVTKARKILINATIGLVIILSAFAITTFIFNSITGALNNTSGGNNNNNGNLPPGGETSLYVRQWQPTNNSLNVPRNVLVFTFFSKDVDATTVGVDDFTFTTGEGAGLINIPFELEMIERGVKIKEKNPCNVSGVQYCLAENTIYRVTISNNIKTPEDKNLECSPIHPCELSFTTGTIIDLTGPNIAIVEPVAYSQIGNGNLSSIVAQAVDQTGVAYVSFQANDINTLPENIVYNEPYRINWQVSGYQEGSTVNLKARAEDICGNVSESGVVPIIIKPAHCFNNTQDEGETGIDCGNGCGACLGESCDSNPSPSCEPNMSGCAVGICDQAQCTCQLNPVILNILPDNGATGNYITIFGQGFGNTPGSITFLGTPATGDERNAPLAACVNAWTSTQIIIEVPAGGVTGGIMLKTSGNRIDTTLDEIGWQGNFTVNSTVRPGVCNIVPNSGIALSTSDLYGKQFTTQATGNSVVAGGMTAAINDWHEQDIESVIPNLNPGQVSVHVKVAGENSNPVFYQVVPDIIKPSIAYLEPNHGPLSTYVTIHGDNFGYNPGDILVTFNNSAQGLSVPADLDFPTICGSAPMNNNEILVKVPRAIAANLGEWQVMVNRANKLSNTEVFTVDNTPLLPGLCLLSPDNGPITTPVDVYGEGFGLLSGLVTFTANKLGAITQWSNAHIKTAVPIASVTGPVSVQSNAGAKSNSISFAVGSCVANSCVPGKECCSDGICRITGTCAAQTGADQYSWAFTTGKRLPPFVVVRAWPQCEEACINSVIGVQFSNPLAIDSITDMSVGVYPCNDDQCNNLGTEIQYRNLGNEVGYYDSNNYILSIVPKNNLQTNKKYRVVIKTGELYIVNTEGGLIENVNYTTNGILDDAYSWTFKTINRLCTLSRVETIPNNTVLYRTTDSADLTSYAYSDPDSCSPIGQQLDAYNFDWGWSITGAVGIANIITRDINNDQKIDPIAKVIPFGPPYQNGLTDVTATTMGYNSTVPVNVSLDIPVISSISPPDGMIRKEVKTLVTILGNNFGDSQKDSYVLVGNSASGYVKAKIADCANSWTNVQIVVEMPLTTRTGDNFKVVKNTGSATSAQTFTVNNILRPALCSLNPPYGTDGSPVTLTGFNFGDTKESSKVFFGQLEVGQIDNWSNTSISVRVPVGADAGLVYVQVLGNNSNSLNFDMSPYITSLSPDGGPVRKYVSIYGGNFGNGYVQFGDVIANIADCEGSWTNNLIIAEVPESMKTGTYDVKVVKNGKLYFRDDFNMANIDTTKWSFNGVADWRIINNSIYVQNATYKQIMFSKTVIGNSDYVYNAKIKPNYPWPVGLVFNYANNNYYLLEMAEYPYTSSYTNPVTGQTSTYTYSDFKGLRLKRNGVVVASTESWVFSRNRWYDVRIEKRAGLIKASIDGSEILSYTDPSPLPNGSVGLYSDYGYYVSFDNIIVGALDANNLESNKKPFTINTDPLGANLCALEPNYGKVGNQTYLRGDNFVSYTKAISTKTGAQYSTATSSCLVNNGTYVGSCVNFSADYAFSFPTTSYYRLTTKTDNYPEDLTIVDIYHQVKVYIDGVYRGEFYNLASNPDLQTGTVDLGQVTAGNHTVRLSWVNDWSDSVNQRDSNIRIHEVKLWGEKNDSRVFFTSNVQTNINSIGMNFINTTITSAVKSGPVKVLKDVVSGQKCVGFHIGSWCPGGVYQDIMTTVESNTIPFYYNADGCMFATDASMDPSFPPVAVQNSQAVGTLATDGKYVYGKSWSSYDENDQTINKIGTGYDGTIAGQDYGTLATVAGGISLTYAPDGFLYNDPCSGNNLEKINPTTGQKTTYTATAGLLNRDTGDVGNGCKMITSDGKYMYSLAYGHDGFRYNGFKVRVYDPANNWSLVREWISGQDSFYTDGIIADGKYVYALAWSGTVRKMDAISGQIIDQWPTHQGHPIGHGQDVISGQYDWINKKVYLGDLVNSSREINQGIYPARGPAYLYRYSCSTGDIPSNDFFITEIKPVSPPQAPRNSLIRIFFNDNLEPTSFENQDVLVQKLGGSEPVQLEYSANIVGNLLELTSNLACPAPNTNLFCWPDLSTIKVTANEGSLLATNRSVLGCFNGKCIHQFDTSNIVDLTPPAVSIIAPVNNAMIARNSIVPIIAEATDDSGISYVEFFVDDQQKARIPNTTAFETDRSYEIVNNSTRVYGADFNKDSNQDLAIFGYYSGSFDILINDGSGKYLPRVNYPLNSYNNIYPVVGDINGDNYPDIIIIERWNSRYGVALNKGNGQFNAINWIRLENYAPWEALLADFDKDGDLDMAINYYASYYNQVSVELYRNNSGVFTRYQLINYTNQYTNYPWNMVAADFNNDGYNDLAVYKNSWDSRDENRLYIYLNNGENGQMEQYSTYKRADWVTDLVAGDFNKDGNQDLVYVSYYWHNYGPGEILYGDGTGQMDTGNIRPLRNFLINGNSDITYLEVVDLNKDGSDDLVLNNNYPARISALISKDGDFAQERILSNVSGWRENIALVDVDKDSYLDLAVTNTTGSVRILENNKDLTFGINQIMNTRPGTNNFETQDLDGDNIPEIITASSGDGKSYLTVQRSNSANGISYQSVWEREVVIMGKTSTGTYSTTGMPYAVALADLNNDYYDDLIISNNRWDISDRQVYLSDGRLNWGSAIYLTSQSSTGIYGQLEIGDLDGGGNPDILSINRNDKFEVEINDGQGVFTEQLIDPGRVDQWSMNVVAWADLNNDGRSDLVYGTRDGLNVVYNNNGQYNFDQKITYISDYISDIMTADIDNDGDQDILALANSSRGWLYVYKNIGGDFLIKRISFSTNNYVGGGTIGDLNNDQLIDVVSYNNNTGKVSVLYNQGNGNFGQETSFSLMGYSYGFSEDRIKIADVNRDNVPDVLVADPSGNGIVFVYNKLNTNLYSWNWDTVGLANNSTHKLQAKAYDLDSNAKMSTPITVKIITEHCTNLVQDEDETGIDCGGADCPACLQSGDFRVVSKRPVGSGVCLNEAVHVTFNKPMDRGSINSSSVQVSCLGGNGCPENGVIYGSFAFTDFEDGLPKTFIFYPDLPNNTWLPFVEYQVKLMPGQIRSKDGELLASQSWVFSTSDATCKVDRIYIEPAEATVGLGSEAQFFASVFDPSGNYLSNPIENWNSSNMAIADINPPVVNGDFSADLNGWSSFVTGTVGELIEIEDLNNNKYLTITGAGKAESEDAYIIAQQFIFIDQQPGNYKLTFNIKTSDNIRKAGVEIWKVDDNYNRKERVFNVEYLDTLDWLYQDFDVNFDGDEKIELNCFLQDTSDNTPTSVSCDNFQLIKGGTSLNDKQYYKGSIEGQVTVQARIGEKYGQASLSVEISPDAPRVLEEPSCTNNKVQSPSPQRGAINVCRQAVISALFTQDLDPQTINKNNIIVERKQTTSCQDSYLPGPIRKIWQLLSENTFGKLTAANFYWCEVSGNLQRYYKNDKVRGFIFSPATNLTDSTDYRITVTPGIKSTSGVSLAANDSWTFTTAANAECIIDHINIDPVTTEIKVGGKGAYQSLAYSPECILINSNGLDWRWQSTNSTKASILPMIQNPSFSERNEDFSPSGWQAAESLYEWQAIDEEGRGRIVTSMSPNPNNYLYQNIGNIIPGASYRIGVWYKRMGPPNLGTGQLSFNGFVIPLTGEDYDVWKKIEIVQPIMNEQLQIRLVINDGRVFFDDVFVELAGYQQSVLGLTTGTLNINASVGNKVGSGALTVIAGNCGNNILDPDESCDVVDGVVKFDPANLSCESMSYPRGGVLGCTVACQVDTSMCLSGLPPANLCINQVPSISFGAAVEPLSFGSESGYTCLTGSNIGDGCDPNKPVIACEGGVCGIASPTKVELREMDISCRPTAQKDGDNQLAFYQKIWNFIKVKILYAGSGCVGTIKNIGISFSNSNKTMSVIVSDGLQANKYYRLKVLGGLSGIRFVNGAYLGTDYISNFATGSQTCMLGNITVTPNKYSFNEANKPDYFYAQAYDQSGSPIISATYHWSIIGNNSIVNLISGDGNPATVSASGTGNGDTTLRVTVDAGVYGTGTVDVPINVFLCSLPWVYQESNFNFSSRYCRTQDKNIAYNSNMETDLDNNNQADGYDQWHNSEISLSHEIKMITENNNKYWQLYSQGEDNIGEAYMVVNQKIMSIVPGKKYTFSGKIKTVISDNRTGTCDDGYGFMEMWELDANGDRIPGRKDYALICATANWQTKAITRNVSSDAQGLEINCGLRTSDNGNARTVSCDDWQLEANSSATTYVNGNVLPALEAKAGTIIGDELINKLFTLNKFGIFDAIGIKAYSNFDHYGPLIWYKANVSNQGSPTSLNVNGYSAISEGRSTYINFANLNNSGQTDDIYSNILLISYTDQANAVTKKIYDEVYKNLTFNNNIENVQIRDMLARDTKRWEDIYQLRTALNNYKVLNGHYPILSAGTYLPNISVSVWDSWQSALGTELGGTISKDPINKHVACPAGYDPITCWRPATSTYSCAAYSYVYKYKSFVSSYNLFMNFEKDDSNWQHGGDGNFTYISGNSSCESVLITPYNINGDR